MPDSNHQQINVVNTERINEVLTFQSIDTETVCLTQKSDRKERKKWQQQCSSFHVVITIVVKAETAQAEAIKKAGTNACHRPTEPIMQECPIFPLAHKSICYREQESYSKKDRSNITPVHHVDYTQLNNYAAAKQ